MQQSGKPTCTLLMQHGTMPFPTMWGWCFTQQMVSEDNGLNITNADYPYGKWY